MCVGVHEEPAGMRVRRVKDFAEIGTERWTALCAKSRTNTIFQTYEWHVSWWEAYGAGEELYLIAVEERSELVAIAPMMVHRDRARKVLLFIGDYRSDYLDFIYDSARPDAVDAIVEYLGEHDADWHRIDLSEVPEDSPTGGRLGGAVAGKGLRYVILRTRACPRLVIKGNESEVMKTIDKKKLRYFRRYFQKRPDYKVSHLAGCEEIGKRMDGFFRQHVERWAGTPTPSIFLEDSSRVFYRRLLSAMCGKGWVTFTVIESEGEPIAYHFGFIYNNVFVVYKPTYNPLLAKHSPGLVLLREMLAFAVDKGYKEFDFTVGDEPYKRRFASDVRYNVSYSILQSERDFVAFRLRTALKRALEGNRLGTRLVVLRKHIKSRLLPRMRETVRRYGLLGWIRRAVGKLLRRFVFRYSRVLFFEMAEGVVATGAVEPRLKDVVFREANLSDLLRFGYPESPVLKQEFMSLWRKSLEEGARCFIAEVGDQVAATIWMRTADHTYIAEAETYLPLDDEPVCFFDAWTLPKFRGKNLLTFLYSKVLEQYRDKRKVAYLYESNVASMRAALKLGNFRLVRVFYLLSVFGLKWRWSRPYKGPQPRL
jgi:CelD/BcsL family acetyltransferase involved in cellulose biosynthesis/RimJ/RimL family protein N-acetyltransferase